MDIENVIAYVPSERVRPVPTDENLPPFFPSPVNHIKEVANSVTLQMNATERILATLI